LLWQLQRHLLSRLAEFWIRAINLYKDINGMSTTKIIKLVSLFAAGLAAMLVGSATALAHCDGLDGPVVKAAQKALEKENVNLVLIWVQKQDEAQIKDAFEKTLAVRKLNAQARELADRYFFETLVRVHRAGEGAPYTGLKPAGRDLGPAVPAADKAIETGDIEPLVKLLSDNVAKGVRERFNEALAKQKFDKNEVAAGREFVRAYVEYIHYVEGIHQKTVSASHGHFSEAGQGEASVHEHAGEERL
jgi:uncharacterized protein DUF6448